MALAFTSQMATEMDRCQFCFSLPKPELVTPSLHLEKLSRVWKKVDSRTNNRNLTNHKARYLFAMLWHNGQSIQCTLAEFKLRVSTARIG